MVSQLQHQRQTFRCPVLSLTLLSWAWSVSPPIPATAKMPELGITRFVFSKAEFSSPFLLMETCAFLLGFLSTPPPTLPRAQNPGSPPRGRLTLSSEGIAFGQSKALSGRPQDSITPKLASRVLQTQSHQTQPWPLPQLVTSPGHCRSEGSPQNTPPRSCCRPCPLKKDGAKGALCQSGSEEGPPTTLLLLP